MSISAAEYWIRLLAATTGLGSLALAIGSMFLSLRRPIGREEGGAHWVLRTPVLLFMTVAFVLMGALLWRPITLDLSLAARAILLVVGTPIFLGGLGLYLWGLRTLGRMFGPSSGFGVRLHAGHRLITSNPYAYVRHPMYLGVIAAAFGSLLIYRTWTMLAFSIMMLGTVFRAKREERILAQEFGAAWEAYASAVPAWLPRLGRKSKPDV